MPNFYCQLFYLKFIVSIVCLHFQGIFRSRNFFPLSYCILWWYTSNSWASSVCSIPYCLFLYFLLSYCSFLFPFFLWVSKNFSNDHWHLWFTFLKCELWLLMLLLLTLILLLNIEVSAQCVHWGSAQCVVFFIISCSLLDLLSCFCNFFVIFY